MSFYAITYRDQQGQIVTIGPLRSVNIALLYYKRIMAYELDTPVTNVRITRYSEDRVLDITPTQGEL